MVKHKTQAAFPKIFLRTFLQGIGGKYDMTLTNIFFQKLVSKDKTALCTSFICLDQEICRESCKGFSKKSTSERSQEQRI